MEIREICQSHIDEIQSLWEKLNDIHLSDSVYFKEHFQTFSFKERSKSLTSMEPDNIKIDVLYDGPNPVGYCISTIQDERGEVSSLFVDEPYRNSGYGKELVDKSIAWLESRHCEKIEVPVVAGHESVFGFYEKFGFLPRRITLRRKT